MSNFLSTFIAVHQLPLSPAAYLTVQAKPDVTFVSFAQKLREIEHIKKAVTVNDSIFTC